MTDKQRLEKYKQFKEENFWNRTPEMQKKLEEAFDKIW